MRVKSPRRQRHNQVLDLAKGYRMSRHRWYKTAREAVIHAGQYAFAGRRLRRRDLRRTWITRINGTLDSMGISYSAFISSLKKTNILIDRKILSDLATRQPKVFAQIVKSSGISFTSKE